MPGRAVGIIFDVIFSRMSDLEYDILDELYFLVHFKQLIANFGLADEEILPILMKLHRKGWIRCYSEPDVELDPKEVDLEIHFRDYYYLASKAGLKAHTS
jgi:transcription initiation factor IIE alpha subunit